MTVANSAIVPILRSLITQYFRQAHTTTALVVLAATIGAVAAIASPYLFSRAIDDLLKAGGMAMRLEHCFSTRSFSPSRPGLARRPVS